MDVFELDRRLIGDYSSYIRSFVDIADQRISQVVEQELAEGLLWPEALIQLNPAFKAGPTVDELVNAGQLHRECAKIFRVGKAQGEGRPLRLHQHQADALAAARSGANYVLTTGTGSGKSLAYILPIVDYVLHHGSGKGIKAIIVYPMNALANSQEGELEKFLCEGYPEGRPPVTFRRYTGQESIEQRNDIRHNPPDILLTNFVMLELLLTRPEERKSLIEAAQGLRFLVLDELHTYRGRQGADVAMLVRRVRNACGGEELQCIGTSATMSSGGTVMDQKREVAAVASLLFGSPVTPDRVVGETLRRATPEHNSADQGFVKELAERVENGPRGAFANVSAFLADPLSSWIESTLGLRVEPGSGVLVRAVPQPIRGGSGIARQLAELTGQPEDRCAAAIQEALLAGYQLRNPDTGLPVFAFRLHQFISRGDAVYASLEAESDRYITVHGQQYVPDDRSRLLWPVVFCRECGQEYYSVWGRRQSNGAWAQFYPRDMESQEPEEDGLEAGYLYVSTKEPWPTDEAGILERVPPDWLEAAAAGERIRPGQRKHVPQAVQVGPDGTVGAGVVCHYQRAPFHLCLKCDVSYSATRSNDAGRLATLGMGGRSTSTTILSLSAVRHLRHDESLAAEARKLLSFTDNRQDASLQAGHLNDFVGVGLVRAGLYRALAQAGSMGLTHEQLTQSVFEALALPLADYAAKKDVRYAARTATDQALREVLGYRIYRDLSRGWRVTSPNLEQCGLLEIAYESLAELSADDLRWNGKHEALVTATPEQRKEVCRVLLDLMRRELAIRVRYLEPVAQDQIRQLSEQWLCEPWALDERESYQMEQARVLLPSPKDRDEQRRNALFVSAQSGFGRYLRRTTTFPNYGAVHNRLKLDDTLIIIGDLLSALDEAGLIQKVGDDGGVPEYQLLAGCMRWKAGDGTRAYQDVIRVPRASVGGGRTNRFFVDFYRNVALDARGIRAHEHTAQVTYDDRVEREKQFRTGELPVLYCSPTMELGVDIAQLNVVNMRNMPPTPANYAQRSGRAGRSGQPALVFTYCSTGSPHDQYFYREPQRMVAGAVTAARIDLTNEDLIRSHVQAIWLAETGVDLGVSLGDILDLSGDPPSLELLPSVKSALGWSLARDRAAQRAHQVLADLRPELAAAGWYNDLWVDDIISGASLAFEHACGRWRDLYRAALRQRDEQHRIIGDHSRTPEDRKRATRLRAEAEAQLKLLTESDNLMQSDFYSYRYFASEGFLPGYNFPRLPLSAYIPARRQRSDARDEFVSRPRFLAVSEFGPRSFIYHEGSRYMVNRVILPADRDELTTVEVKLCPSCGYLHQIAGGVGPDRCERCGESLELPMKNLFRMQNVVTKRRDRISADEEERQRWGYHLRTAMRFAEQGGQVRARRAEVTQGGKVLANLTYGHAATLWRINLGWSRRKDEAQQGFVLDTERGFWSRRQNDLAGAADDDPDADPIGAKTARVIPFVEDRRNCLLFEPVGLFEEDVISGQTWKANLASLQAALKNAIQVVFELEDAELAAEPLPDEDERRLLLFYEAAEGGAGVLRRLVDDPSALAKVATKALELCHFDPQTGQDLGHAPRAKENCASACYDCLMSYGNQRDHLLLDRHSIRDQLLALARARVEASPTAGSRAAHLERLLSQCDPASPLEKQWLEFIEARQLRLPTHAQYFIQSCHTTPDFFYAEHALAVYIDGSVHDHEDIKVRDQSLRTALRNAGYEVVVFGQGEDWGEIVARYPHVFGECA